MRCLSWLMVLLFCCLFSFSVAAEDTQKDPIIGSWEYSDGSGYFEVYNFLNDSTFFAKSLGEKFTGTWKNISVDHYQTTYWNNNDTMHNKTYQDIFLFDNETDSVYFPPHKRVINQTITQNLENQSESEGLRI
jgi:hypothetical protein